MYMNAVQLDFFKPVTEIECLQEEVFRQKKELGNIRRGVFARLSAMEKEIIDLKEMNDRLIIQINTRV